MKLTAPVTCPACEAGPLRVFCEMPDVPVFCNVLWDSEAKAKAAPRGDIVLGFCACCGHVYNTAFDPRRVAYSPHYENSLHFSPHFQSYAEALAHRLVETYDVHEKDVIEIGCGKGEFLALLCRAGGNRGLGFDASFDPARLGPAPEGLEVIRDHYSRAHRDRLADLIVCRHVLEHIDEPLPFTNWVREAAGLRSGSAVYFEVPNVLFTLEDLGIWDLIYEHCSYFSPHSLARLFRRCGFSLARLYTAYGDQFLCVEARAEGPDLVATLPGPELAALSNLVDGFARHHAAKIATWRSALAAWHAEGKRVALWGTGSKGVTFINVIPEARQLAAVIDLNPNKHGRHVPGTGHVVTSPTAHAAGSLDTVLVMNPVYEAEIRSQLRALGHQVDVHVV